MTDFWPRHRVGNHTPLLACRYEKAGLVLDQAPIPWNADALLVEALVRLPENLPRRRSDFQVRLAGQDPIAAEEISPRDTDGLYRLRFRLPPPTTQTTVVDLLWRGYLRGRVTVPFLGLALWALRNVAIAPLVCLPAVARAVAVDPEQAARTKAEERRGPIGVALVVVLAVFAGAVFVRAFAEPDFVTVTYPVKAMNVVEREGLIGRRLLMDDGDAAYAVLGWYPEQKVFIDDRYDMYPEKVIYDFFDLSSGDRDWAKILARYDVEVVVWPRREPLTQFMERSGDWTVIHRDRSWVALVRNDLAP